MDKWIEEGYINRLSIPLLRRTGDGYNGRCPICGDSKKSRTKKRLWIITRGRDFITVHCFNCGLNTNLKKFIQMTSPTIFEEYLDEEKKSDLEYLQNGSFELKKKTTPKNINTSTDDLKLFKLNESNFLKVSKSVSHLAYCRSRKIPEEIIDTLYFCNKEKYNSINGIKNNQFYGMLIFPFYCNEELYGFQGRSITNKMFGTFSNNDSFKVYNIFNVDKTKPVIVFESIIDSFAASNSISMLGADLSERVRKVLGNAELIYLFDNDKTGLLKSIKYANLGYKIFIWPSNLKKFKDFNQIICNTNLTKQQLNKIIEENTFQGTEATVKLDFKSMEKF